METDKNLLSKMENNVEILQDILQLVLENHLVDPETLRHSKVGVVDFLQPKDLEKTLKLEISDDPLDKEELLKFCKDVIRYSVKTCHPFFFNQLYKGVDNYSVAGAWLSDILNTSAATYEISPVFTVLENALLKHTAKILGWPQHEGIFSPGGSLANMYGMVLARYKAYPSVKTKGMNGLPTMVAFASEEAHYSLVKGSCWLGMGSECVSGVKSDDCGKMKPEELERMILEEKAKGHVPFFVCATAGTTVLGAFDPLRPLAEVCKKHGLWLHVDAAFGGTALLSQKHRHLMDGIELVDSVTWDFHKMAGIPFQCTVFLTRHKGLLFQCNSLHAEYLFQPDKYYDASYDTGDRCIQCGRKVDTLKLWLAWQGRGAKGMEMLVDTAFEMTRYLAKKMSQTEGFRLVLPQFEGTSVCFWFIPPSLRGMEENNEFWEKVSKVAPILKGRMMKAGTLMINYQAITSKGFVNFFRVTLGCLPVATKEDMDFVITEIARLGSDL